ncbi:MAG: flagellin [Myxococcota bacterium]|jgi:flagellin
MTPREWASARRCELASAAWVTVLELALDQLNTSRADLGAKGNRLQVAASAVSLERENLSAANSRIRDTDVAAETSAMSRSQVLVQRKSSDVRVH